MRPRRIGRVHIQKQIIEERAHHLAGVPRPALHYGAVDEATEHVALPFDPARGGLAAKFRDTCSTTSVTWRALIEELCAVRIDSASGNRVE
jgi:hypothetical protein